MTAAILSTGTELIRGELVNTNSQWLCEQLTSLGFSVVECTAVADQQAHIIEALNRLAKASRVVICTGGLGPTTDDLVREAAAAAKGVDLVRDESALEAIKARFKRFGRTMAQSNVKQAFFPAGAEVLPNAVGTAPGFSMTIQEALCLFLPGVPSEMKNIFELHVKPKISELAERNTYQVHLQTFGLTESNMADQIADLKLEESATPSVTIGYRAHFPVIELKISARASDEKAAQAIVNQAAERVRERLGSYVFGGRDDSFAEHLGRVLRDKGLSLAVAESCTGGLVGKFITDAPGSSEYLLLDTVTYSDQAKNAILGVDAELIAKKGAVSVEVASAMAQGVLRLARSDIAVAITGIAGPGGGTADKPVGMVCFAVATKTTPVKTLTRKLPGNRDYVRVLSAYIAMKMVVEAAQLL